MVNAATEEERQYTANLSETVTGDWSDVRDEDAVDPDEIRIDEYARIFYDAIYSKRDWSKAMKFKGFDKTHSALVFIERNIGDDNKIRHLHTDGQLKTVSVEDGDIRSSKMGEDTKLQEPKQGAVVETKEYSEPVRVQDSDVVAVQEMLLDILDGRELPEDEIKHVGHDTAFISGWNDGNCVRCSSNKVLCGMSANRTVALCADCCEELADELESYQQENIGELLGDAL